MGIQPPLPLPPPLRGAEPGSFARYSVEVRLPDIGRRILQENDFPAAISHRLEALIAEIPAGPLRSLQDAEAPDAQAWQAYLQPYLGQDWLEIPWFLAEQYFYRRVMEATGYFRPGEGHLRDPFAKQKQAGLQSNQAAIAAVCSRATQVQASGRTAENIALMLSGSLQGNLSDLSLWPAGEDRSEGQEALSSHLLVDDSLSAGEYLVSGHKRVDFILDNAALELVWDLALADVLLSTGCAGQVVFHLKAHPTFVSDALPEDIHQALAFLKNGSHPDQLSLARRLGEFLRAGKLLLTSHFFWNSPLALWEMPPGFRQDLSGSGLLLFKGDANYRRILGDRHWPLDTPFELLTRYRPAPLLALRVLKAEIAAGLPSQAVASTAQEDPRWMFDGKWAVIQLAV